MTRWACSTFNNELDVLEIRLAELDPVVDRFILAEATVTQRNQPKDLYFEANKDRYAKWLDKIDYLVVDDMPPGEGVEADWVRERFQRNAIARVLYPQLEPGDQVLVSDLDEIPYPEVLEDCWDQPPMRICMDMILYALNWRWLDRGCEIGSTASVHQAAEFNNNQVHDVMLSGWVSNYNDQQVAGWHLSYQGGVQMIRDKILSIADRFYEQLVPDDKKVGREVFLTDGWIQGCIDTGRDIYGRDYRPSEWFGMDDKSMPAWVQKHPDRFAHMMVPEPEEPIGIIRCNCGGYYDNAGVLQHFQKCELYVEAVAAT